MRNIFAHKWLRILLSAVVCLQLALPGALALVQPDRLDTASWICAPSGQVSQDGINAIEEFLKHTRHETPGGADGLGHCPFCASVEIVLALPNLVATLPCAGKAQTPLFNDNNDHGRFAISAPLGGRAPPPNHKI